MSWAPWVPVQLKVPLVPTLGPQPPPSLLVLVLVVPPTPVLGATLKRPQAGVHFTYLSLSG